MPPATPGRRGVRRARGALCAAVLVSLAACAQATHEASWPDLVTARQQDAIDREWIPEFLPEATREIRQRNEPATGARIVVARLATDVPIPECEGPSDTTPPLEASWLPAMRGTPMACADGWTVARNDDVLTAWHVGDLEVVE